jgi:AraC-like DNA-binding protein/mannose-6-phosphate isomerase-like protein (cupin superfamily)
MNIANLPIAKPVDHGRVNDPQRPILTMSYRLGPGRTPPHRHSRAHLFYCAEGVFQIVRKEATWMVPPSQAVWIPSNVEHSAYATQPVALLSLFVDASATAGLPDDCRVVHIAPLLRELILKAVEVGNEYAATGTHARLMQVVLDELQGLVPAPLSLPLAADKRVRQLCEALLAHPADERSLEAWAPRVGASARTLARLFVSETGLTFAEWRRQMRLLEAIDRLGKGQTVTRVALDLGYESPSAFIAMFRRTLGASPGKYFKNAELGSD